MIRGLCRLNIDLQHSCEGHLNHDPAQEDGGANLYAFNANDPVNNIDPLGLQPDDIVLRPGVHQIHIHATAEQERPFPLKSVGDEMFIAPGIQGKIVKIDDRRPRGTSPNSDFVKMIIGDGDVVFHVEVGPPPKPETRPGFDELPAFSLGRADQMREDIANLQKTLELPATAIMQANPLYAPFALKEAITGDSSLN